MLNLENVLVTSILLLAFMGLVAYVLRRLKEKSEREFENEERQKRQRERMNSERVKQAKVWKEWLATFGIHHSVETLTSMDDGRVLEKNQIPYQTVFKDEEYVKLISLICPENAKAGYQNSYFGSFTMDALAVAIHVKELTVYMQNLEDAMKVLVEKERSKRLSEKEMQTKRELQREMKQCKTEINGYCTLEITSKVKDGDQLFVDGDILFNPYASLDEEKVLELVASKIGTGKPELKEPVATGTYVTSPALEELNTFLNEKALPDEKVQELRETMRDIQHKLREELDKEEEENTLLQADVLNKTSRQFHQLESTS